MQTATSGGRRLSRSALEARSFKFERDRIVTRKELGQVVREAQKALNLRPGIRQVLQELAACWGEQALDGQILVWPSNEFLVEKTGLSERSIRYALRSLIADKLILPKDSANGKRFAIKNKAGGIVDAFGFDLRPLYVRRDEFLETIDAQEQEREHCKRQFDDITIMRRATQEAIRALSEKHPGARIDDLEAAFQELVQRTPRRSARANVDQILEQWCTLRELAENRYLESGSGGKNGRHIETNNDSSTSCNNGFENGYGQNGDGEILSLRLLVEATPVAAEYGHRITTWPEAFAAARDFRPVIGAHKSAWEEAVTGLGLETASATVLYVAQLVDDDHMANAGRIKNPGGYFRAMVRMIIGGKLNLASELSRLRKRKA